MWEGKVFNGEPVGFVRNIQPFGTFIGFQKSKYTTLSGNGLFYENNTLKYSTHFEEDHHIVYDTPANEDHVVFSKFSRWICHINNEYYNSFHIHIYINKIFKTRYNGLLNHKKRNMKCIIQIIDNYKLNQRFDSVDGYNN